MDLSRQHLLSGMTIVGAGLLTANALAAQNGAGANQPYDHVILISVDGLRGDALAGAGDAYLPAFHRLRQGASTLNARTDLQHTVTLPNHVCMITGRPVEGEAGHLWRHNGPPPRGWTLHNSGAGYVSSVFDLAHEEGVTTALFASKGKFLIFGVSYEDSIDEISIKEDVTELTSEFLSHLDGADRSFTFLHYLSPDVAGHGHGWSLEDGSPYRQAIEAVDREIGRVLEFIDDHASLADSTAIIVTADHGGGKPFRSHTESEVDNAWIPFLVWTSRDEWSEPADLYELNRDTRCDPGTEMCATSADGWVPPPIHNGDAANLALQLLGLPPAPGSTINANQDLAILPRPVLVGMDREPLTETASDGPE